MVLSSEAYNFGQVNLEDVGGQQSTSSSYSRWSAYGASKQANQLYTVELARRCGPCAGDVDRCLAWGVVFRSLAGGRLWYGLGHVRAVSVCMCDAGCCAQVCLVTLQCP